jgi:hypothetical protein
MLEINQRSTCTWIVFNVEKRSGDIGHLIIYAKGLIGTDNVRMRGGVVD